jgi:hypothetical protein
MLSLLAQCPAFKSQRDADTEAIVQESFGTLAKLLRRERQPRWQGWTLSRDDLERKEP